MVGEGVMEPLGEDFTQITYVYLKKKLKKLLFHKKMCIFAPWKLNITLNDLAIYHKWTHNRHSLFAIGNRFCIGL